MAICQNGKTFYISYKLKLPDGKYITRNIKNKERTSKRFVKSIEAEEIESDKKKCLANYGIKTDANFQELVEMFLNDEEMSKRKGTVYAKRKKAYKYLVPVFSPRMKIADLFTIKSLTNALNKIREMSKENTKTSTNELYNSNVRLLREIVDYAMIRDYCPSSNYPKTMKLLSNVKIQKNVENEKLVFWTPEQFQTFLTSFDNEDTKWRYFFLVSYYGGLRIGEVLGLTWSDINFDHNIISINKTLDYQGEVAVTKNISSNATVSLPPFLIEELKQFKEELGASDSDYVFFKKNTSRTAVRRMMGKHEKLANVPHIKFHGLRHSIASALIESGENVKYVSSHLRHASTQQTLDTYSHIFPNITKNVFDKLTSTPK